MTFWQKLKRCFAGFVADEAPQAAAAISFYAVTSLPPLVVLLVSVTGLLIKDESFQAYLIGQAGQLFGPSGAEVVSTIILHSQDQQHGWAAVIGLVTLVITASGLHAQLQAALNKVWNIERIEAHLLKRFVGDRLVATLTLAATGFLLVISLFVTTFLKATSSWVSDRLNIDFITVQRTQSLVTLLLLTAMIALLYKLLPDARVAWADVWRGAFLTALLFIGARQLLALYLARVSFTMSYGQAGTLVLLLVWIYFSALIFLFGAEWTSVEAEARGRDIVAKVLPKQLQVMKSMKLYPASSGKTLEIEPDDHP